nr:helix-turn-helix domain-containing protein [Acaryochloris sp. CCMEE 5410]
MPRKLYLEPHFSPDELKSHYRASQDPVESRRWHLLWLVSEQTTLTQAAQVVGLNYDYAREIVREYNHNGAHGLRNRRKDKRPHQSRSLLTQDQCAQLLTRLQPHPPTVVYGTAPK